MKVIIFHEKHGDIIYDASTNEALVRACASHIKSNYNDGCYTEFDPEWADIERLISVDWLDEAAAMEYTWKTSKGIKSTSLAWHIIQIRGDYEYEGFDIETLIDPTW